MLFGEIVVLLLNLTIESRMLNLGACPSGAQMLNSGPGGAGHGCPCRLGRGRTGPALWIHTRSGGGRMAPAEESPPAPGFVQVPERKFETCAACTLQRQRRAEADGPGLGGGMQAREALWRADPACTAAPP